MIPSSTSNCRLCAEIPAVLDQKSGAGASAVTSSREFTRVLGARHDQTETLNRTRDSSDLLSLFVRPRHLRYRKVSSQEYLDDAARLAETEGLDLWTSLMRVLVMRLETLVLPAPLSSVLQRASMHWFGKVGDLSILKIEVWQFINDNWRSGSDIETPEGRAARALLCVLEPGGDDEYGDSVAEWFATMVDEHH